MRIKVTKFSNDTDKSNEPGRIIMLNHKNKTLKVRIINVVLPSGQVEKLVTNIMDENYTNEDFKKLYFKRWESKLSIVS